MDYCCSRAKNSGNRTTSVSPSSIAICSLSGIILSFEEDEVRPGDERIDHQHYYKGVNGSERLYKDHNPDDERKNPGKPTMPLLSLRDARRSERTHVDPPVDQYD